LAGVKSPRRFFAAPDYFGGHRKLVPTTPQFDAMVDHRFNDFQRFAVCCSKSHNNSPTGVSFVQDAYEYKTDVFNMVADYTWTVTPAIVNTGRVGADRVVAPGITDYPDLTAAGFPSYMINNGLSRMPTMAFASSYSKLFDQCCVDTHFAHTLYTYSSSLSWVKSSHSIKLGGEQRTFFNTCWQPDYPTGLFTFGPDVTNQKAANEQFSLRDNAKLQVRMEAFNAFNRSRFDRADVGWGRGSFGQVNALAQGFRPRQLQIVARVEF
jgi:hypothetical protein